MVDEQEKQKRHSVDLCDRLLCQLNNNKEDAYFFLGGDMHVAYVKATEGVINNGKRIRNKIKNL